MDGIEKLLGYLVVIFLFVVLPGILSRMARKRAAQQAQARQAGEAPAEGRPAEAEEREEARTSQVERYLETLGIKIERKPAPAPRPQPPPVLRPEPAPAAESRIVYEARPEEVREFLDALGGGPAAPPAAPRPHRVRVAAPAPRRPAPVVGEPADEGPPPPKPAAPPPARPARRPLGVLGHRPNGTELQKAIILSEIVRRPDFDRDPFDRLII